MNAPTAVQPAEPTVIICRAAQFPLRGEMTCPTCKTVQQFAGVDSGPYYSTSWTCCACGDSWSDGERQERPFRRAWRSEAVARAKRVWEAAGEYTKADHNAWLRDLIGITGEAAR